MVTSCCKFFCRVSSSFVSPVGDAETGTAVASFELLGNKTWQRVTACTLFNLHVKLFIKYSKFIKSSKWLSKYVRCGGGMIFKYVLIYFKCGLITFWRIINICLWTANYIVGSKVPVKWICRDFLLLFILLQNFLKGLFLAGS